MGRFFSLKKREGWKRELACYLELCGMTMWCEELRQPSWEHDGDTDEKLKLAGQMKEPGSQMTLLSHSNQSMSFWLGPLCNGYKTSYSQMHTYKCVHTRSLAGNPERWSFDACSLPLQIGSQSSHVPDLEFNWPWKSFPFPNSKHSRVKHSTFW